MDKAFQRRRCGGDLQPFRAGRYDYRGQPERGFEDICGLLRRSLSDRTRHYSYSLEIKEDHCFGRSCRCAAGLDVQGEARRSGTRNGLRRAWDEIFFAKIPTVAGKSFGISPTRIRRRPPSAFSFVRRYKCEAERLFRQRKSTMPKCPWRPACTRLSSALRRRSLLLMQLR